MAAHTGGQRSRLQPPAQVAPGVMHIIRVGTKVPEIAGIRFDDKAAPATMSGPNVFKPAVHGIGLAYGIDTIDNRSFVIWKGIEQGSDENIPAHPPDDLNL
jgi:hypothetical protein